MDARLIAAKVLGAVRQGGSLDRELPRLAGDLADETRATVQALVYGALRQFELIDWLLRKLVRKPMKKKDTVIEDLLRIALFELLDEVTPDYAIVNSAVKLARKQRSWSAGLVNGSLRRFQRERDQLLADAHNQAVSRWLLPEWLLKTLRNDWPEQWQSMASALAKPAPMTLRVKLSEVSIDEYIKKNQSLGIKGDAHQAVKSAIVLSKPVSVLELPGFEQGHVTVQDAAAQLAAPLLDPQAGERVLDACAAPGGKTTHLWEYAQGQIEMTALEISPARISNLEENLLRALCRCEVKQADAADLDSWWDGQLFDRILLDAPCTATGVIRRHPDIKLHRRPSDVEQTVAKQRMLLQRLWQTLAPGGTLLYATCSLLAAENSDQITEFLSATEDAVESPIEADWGVGCHVGRQILPGEQTMDGFYYVRLKKETT